MGSAARERAQYRFKRLFAGNTHDYSARGPSEGTLEAERLSRMLARVRYNGWTFSTARADDHRNAIAFRPDPAEPTRLQKLGPWPLPEDPDEEQIMARILDAVASVDGEDARGTVRLLPPKN